MDGLPHPHNGLLTVNYLFSGELVLRDSHGVKQGIRPGEGKLDGPTEKV